MEYGNTRIQAAEYQSLRNFLKHLEAGGSGLTEVVAQAVREDLTERQAQMVRMYFMEQRSMREIAACLGVNPSTVSRTLSVARAKLRRDLRMYAKGYMLDGGV